MTRPHALLPTLILAGLAVAPASAQSPEDQKERNRQIVTEAFERWAAGGTDFFEEVLSPDVVWIIEGSGPSAGVYEGRDDFLARAVAPFGARLTGPVVPTVRHVWADGDHVIAHWDGATTALDGQPYANSYAWIFRMQEGMATEVTAFLDLVPYDAVLARIPEPK